MLRTGPLIPLGGILIVATTMLATVSAQTTIRFEVASVRESESRSRAPIPSMRVVAGRVEIHNAPLPWLMSNAYRLEPSRMVLPSGLAERRFDIAATIPDGVPRAKVPEMLQALLQDRFGLKGRIELRETPVFELTQRDGGHKMIPVSPMNEMKSEISEKFSGVKILLDSVSSNPDSERRRVTREDGLIIVLTSTSRYEFQITLRQSYKLTAIRMPMSELIPELRSRVDRPVVDGTGLSGFYKFETELPFDLRNAQIARSLAPPRADGTAMDPIANPAVPTVDKALEVLGLRLRSRELPVAVLVVSSVQPLPTPN